MKPRSSDQPLYPAEIHHFNFQGKALLFDVNSLQVIPSADPDADILAAAKAGLRSGELARQVARKRNIAPAQVARRVKSLIRHNFLLPEGVRPQKAELRQPTSYSTFMVNVSQRCNLTCPYCYVNEGLFDYEVKPIPKMQASVAGEIVEKIHANFPDFETYGYHFYGGEPLMNFKVIEQIVGAAETKARETGTKTDYHITTNGTLLKREIADFMDAHRFTVYFSIDGDEQNHDELRKYRNGRGSYRQVKRNLEYLEQKKGVHLIGSSVIRKGFTLKKAINLLEDHGASQCKAERVRLKSEDSLALVGDEHKNYIEDIEGLFQHYVEYLSEGRKPLDFRLSSKILQLLTRVRRDFFCPAGDRMFGVSADGEIYPCALHVGRPQSKLGDIATGLDRDKQKAFREKFSTANQTECRTCWTRHLCGGGCSAMVDRFGHEDCRSLRAESEAAIAIYHYFMEHDPVALYGLVSPKIARWVKGELEDEAELAPTEPAALTGHGCGCHGEQNNEPKLYQIRRESPVA